MLHMHSRRYNCRIKHRIPLHYIADAGGIQEWSWSPPSLAILNPVAGTPVTWQSSQPWECTVCTHQLGGLNTAGLPPIGAHGVPPTAGSSSHYQGFQPWEQRAAASFTSVQSSHPYGDGAPYTPTAQSSVSWSGLPVSLFSLSCTPISWPILPASRAYSHVTVCPHIQLKAWQESETYFV